MLRTAVEFSVPQLRPWLHGHAAHSVRQRAWPLLVLAAAMFSACDDRTGPKHQTISVPARYELAGIEGERLPFRDADLSARVIGGAIEVYRSDSLRLISTTRDLFLERIPCEVLRTAAISRGSGGLGSVSDTSTKGCDDLRVVTDTETVGYAIRGDSIVISSNASAAGTVDADTMRLIVNRRFPPEDVPVRERAQFWVYVRR